MYGDSGTDRHPGADPSCRRPKSKSRSTVNTALLALLCLVSFYCYCVQPVPGAETNPAAQTKDATTLWIAPILLLLGAAWYGSLRYAVRREAARLGAQVSRLEKARSEERHAHEELLVALGHEAPGSNSETPSPGEKEYSQGEKDAQTQALERLSKLNELKEVLLADGAFEDKLHNITENLAKLFDADFCRIWLTRPGDLCAQGCVHALDVDGPHTCQDQAHCLHLMASAGSHGGVDSKMHHRVPFGCYKIGRVGGGQDKKFLTNDIATDRRVPNPQWADQLGLVSFAGYKLASPAGDAMGVLAFFSKHPISPEDDALLESMANSIAQAIQTAQAEQARERLVIELTDALANIKTLKGLLPICASCKSIREDSGYWKQIESYVGEHSQAEFTHGICPDCKKKLYPELYDDEGDAKAHS
jgi:hypothetical protein